MTTSLLGPMNASISFPGNVACGGSASLVLHQDGTFAFNGSFHDSGFVPYGVGIAFVVTSTTGKAFSFSKSGTVYGTADILADSTKSRDFGWATSGSNPQMAAAWADLVAGSSFHWKSDVNVDLMQLLNSAIAVAKAAVPAITAVVAVL